MRRIVASLTAPFLLIACSGQSLAPTLTAANAPPLASAVAPLSANSASTPTPVAVSTMATVTTPQAGPKLYVYRGAGCTGAAALPQFESFVGRKVDGVVDFNDYSGTAANAVSNLNWQLGCWQGHTADIAISIGMAFSDTTTAQIASGAADAIFRQMGASLVSHGFANAKVRLGWEMNGGWYKWGQQGATFGQAFTHAATILKATSGSNFTIVFNPTAGMDPSSEMPAGAAGVDAMGWDDYANTWSSGGVALEPVLWNGDLLGVWGYASGLTSGNRGWWTHLGVMAPEFGVGSRSDGHGACSGTGANDCDDPYFMSQALAAFASGGVSLVGYWDYNAGDYNSMISDASRPNEALAFIQAMGAPSVQSYLKGATVAAIAPATVTSTVSGGPKIYTIPLTLSDGSQALLLWGASTASQTLTITLRNAASISLIGPTGATALTKSTTALPYTYAGGQTLLHFGSPTSS